jgi:hypothetical protein
MTDENVAVLQARIVELEAALRLKSETLTSRYKLTPAMGSLLGLLVELPIVHDETICGRLKIAANAKVAIYRLRRQLGPSNITVHSRRGSGWYLDEETKNQIRLAVTSTVTDAS